MICGMEEDEWAYYMTEFLQNGTVPPAHCQQDIYENQHLFTVLDGFLYRVEDGHRSPYTLQALRTDFLERMHNEYGHLGHPGILGIITGRVVAVPDIKSYVSLCPQCQVSQRSRPRLEREEPQTLTNSGL